MDNVKSLRSFSTVLLGCLCAGVWAGSTYVWTGQSSANESGVGRWMDTANWTMNDAPATTPPVNLRLTVGETATYPAAFTFPEGSTISIEGLENVRKEDHGYTLADFPAGVANLPPLVDELPAKWQLMKSGTALRLSYVKGATIIFR